MGIEPIGSAMTYQVQQPQTRERTPEPTEKQIREDVPNVDASTVAVEKTDNKGADYDGKQDQEYKQASNEQIKKAVEELNRKMYNSEALFGIHEATNRITIKIVDKETKEVIKELPPEKTLDMIAKAWELAGLLVDEKR